MSRKAKARQKSEPRRGNTGGGSVFGRRSTSISVLIIIAVALVFFWRIIFLGEILTGGDVLAGATIFSDYGKEQLAAGHYPFWNPYIFSGMPLYASMTYNAYIYPSHWLMWLLDNITAGTAPRLTFLFLHYVLAGLGMMFYLRSRRVGHAGAVIGGLAYMVTPHLVGLASIGHGGKVLTAAYIPLILMAAQKLLDTANRRWLALLGLFGGLQFLARHIQVSYYTWLMVGLLLVFYISTRDRRADPAALAGKKTAMLIGAGLLAVALAAVLLLPVGEYSAYSTRTALEGGMGFDQATMWSFHPKELATFLVPSMFGLEGQTYWGTMPFQQASHYVGYVVLCLAAVALIRKRDRSVTFLGLVLALGVFLSFGRHIGPVFRLMYSGLPGFSRFRVPALFLLLAQFAAAGLAGHGASVLLGEGGEEKRGWLRWAIAVAGVGMAVGAVVLLWRGAITHTAVSALMSKHPGVAGRFLREVGTRAARLAARDAGILIAFALATGVMFFVVATRRLKGWLAALLVGGLLVWDVAVVDSRFLHPEKMEPLPRYYPETPAIKFLKEQPGIFRIAPLSREFSSNSWMYHRLESIGGYHPAKLALYEDLLTKVDITNAKLLALLNVKYVVGPTELDHPLFSKVAEGVYENKLVLPRAFLVGEARELTSEGVMLAELSVDSFEPWRYATVLGNLPGPVESAEGSEIEITSYEPEEIRVRADIARPCLLVFSEVYYPPGWKAFVDGAPTEIYRADYAFRSVYLEPGEHIVVMRYVPSTARRGLLISLLAAGLIALTIALPARRSPSRRIRP